MPAFKQQSACEIGGMVGMDILGLTPGAATPPWPAQRPGTQGDLLPEEVLSGGLRIDRCTSQ